jgi:hypothetical protein
MRDLALELRNMENALHSMKGQMDELSHIIEILRGENSKMIDITENFVRKLERGDKD